MGKGTGAPAKARVLLVASSGAAPAVVETLVRLGHEVTEAGPESIGGAGAVGADLVLVDSSLVGRVGQDLALPVFVLGEEPGPAAGRIATLQRTAGREVLEPLLALALAMREVTARCRELEGLAAGLHHGSAIVGKSPAIRRLQSSLRRAADTDATILIEGPAGSGKSLAARTIHLKSRRGNLPIMTHDCGSLDADGVALALERARATTIVLENIDRLPAPAQAVVVRQLKERPGAAAQVPARVVATTSAHLPELVARGAFREDLYYRLHTFPILLPALRERPEDIVDTAMSILSANSAQSAPKVAGFTPAAVVLLESMAWPGNVTQLENVVLRAQAAAGGGSIDRVHLLGIGAVTPAGSEARGTAPQQVAAESTVEEAPNETSIRPFIEEEQRMLSRALQATRGNVRRAAQLLGIGRATLYRKIQQYRLRLH
jgi:DNA-binding NtrC family response regulator